MEKTEIELLDIYALEFMQILKDVNKVTPISLSYDCANEMILQRRLVFESWKTKEKIVYKEIEIRDLDLNVRAMNCLLAADIKTVSELCKFTYNQLFRFPNVGHKTIREIREALNKHNLDLNHITL